MRTIKHDARASLSFSTTWPQLAYALTLAVLLATGTGGVVRPLYLVGGLAVGLRLQSVSPAAYVSFVLWLWFLTPFVRRVADLYASWQDPSFILLTPYLVTGLSAVPFIQRQIQRRPSQPHERPVGTAMLALAALGTAVGIPLGFILVPYTALLETLNYLTPLLFGWYVATRSDHLQEIERALAATFGRAALIIGVYGIYQFTYAPPWDVVWMQNTEMASIGRPEPFAIRVFSTMHSPGVLGPFLAVALALWLAKPSARGIPSASVATITLLLSQVRSAWLGFMVAAVLVVASLKPSQQLRAVVFIGLVIMLMGASLLTPEMSELVDARIQTLERLDEDSSALSRLAGHAIALELAALRPLGLGIGQDYAALQGVISMRDSVIVAVLVQFGLIGSVFYLLALAMLLVQLWRYYRRAATTQGVALACAGIGLLALAPLGVVTAGPTGMCVWMIGGLAVADRHQARVRAARVLRSTQKQIQVQAARRAPAATPA